MTDPILARLAKRPPARIGFPVAVAAVALTIMLRITVLKVIPGYGLLVFYPAIVIVAATCGLWPALFTTVLSLPAAWYFQLPIPSSGAWYASWQLPASTAFLTTSALICVLIHWLRRTIRELRAARDLAA